MDELTDMSKALRLVVAVVVLERGILLCAIVPGQLEKTLTISCGVYAVGRLGGIRETVVARVAEKIKIELCVLVLACSEEAHTENFLVELEGLLVILDSDHGVVLSLLTCVDGIGLGSIPFCRCQHPSL